MPEILMDFAHHRKYLFFIFEMKVTIYWRFCRYFDVIPIYRRYCPIFFFFFRSTDYRYSIPNIMSGSTDIRNIDDISPIYRDVLNPACWLSLGLYSEGVT